TRFREVKGQDLGLSVDEIPKPVNQGIRNGPVHGVPLALQHRFVDDVLHQGVLEGVADLRC
ncbi:MAG: hypothetical protein QGF53_01790, partial [Alphaproteobacteria bacterium]|nr:hypothetical protein [Alphaproteobacteria bacterium]